MGKGLLDPKVDFVFKNIFGMEKHPEILISFLNATLKSDEPITSVEIKSTDLEKQFVEDKYSRMDIKAVTSKGEIINIEIQLKNEYNMVKRSLYYLSKMYEEQLAEGEDYSQLKRTICINILNFKYLKTENFHTSYRFKEMMTHEELTDVMEVHFIEIPKLPKNCGKEDMLAAWTEFLRDPESEAVRSLELSVKELREAKDELIRLSNNEEQRALYEMRAKILRDKVSALNYATQQGLQQGLRQGLQQGLQQGIGEGEKKTKTEIVKKMLNAGLDIDLIAQMTGLTSEEIEAQK